MTASPISLPLPPRLAALYASGLAVFYGQADMPRLAHAWFLRALALNPPQQTNAPAPGARVLFLDGANRFDPLLVARFARRRERILRRAAQPAAEAQDAPADLNQRIRVARAFTCFQLTELVLRAPQMLERFPAGLVVVTALPDLYYDEDVREAEAAASFRRAREGLRELAARPLTVGVFTDAPSILTPRRRFFRQLAAQAGRVWQVMRRESSAALPAAARGPGTGGALIFRPVSQRILPPRG